MMVFRALVNDIRTARRGAEGNVRLGSTMRRIRPGPELMDDPAIPRSELADALRFIRAVHPPLGGSPAPLQHLRRWSRHWPKAGTRPITMLDIATGSADIPIVAVRWAKS